MRHTVSFLPPSMWSLDLLLVLCLLAHCLLPVRHASGLAIAIFLIFFRYAEYSCSAHYPLAPFSSFHVCGDPVAVLPEAVEAFPRPRSFSTLGLQLNSFWNLISWIFCSISKSSFPCLPTNVRSILTHLGITLSGHIELPVTIVSNEELQSL